MKDFTAFISSSVKCGGAAEFICLAILLRTSSAGYGLTKEVIILYWNTTNPIFRIDNNDNIIDVGSSPMVYDQVNIVCPVYSPGSISEENTEQFVIYHVNKEEYDTCRIMKPYPRIIAKCNTPFKPGYFTISFRSFSPTPGALEFHPGKDYYFISTSSKDDIHRRLGGSCLSNNMKVVFKVTDKTATSTPVVKTSTPSINTERNYYAAYNSTSQRIDPFYVRDTYYNDDGKEELPKKQRRRKKTMEE
ncbi:EFNB [Lepeophtheirus salmonis]|uniref:EFNB n=1 Tax=Lepeophtheirus salmonis TaxID=72036 RepID=A0A7R8CMR2_LEPSM|nr:EFNB [Lepeophtheirus salmonis]CAF2835497.1 EFNB [Lepeophtheirus salmonis]